MADGVSDQATVTFQIPYGHIELSQSQAEGRHWDRLAVYYNTLGMP